MKVAMTRRLRRYGVASVIAAAPLAILCAYVTNLLVPTEPLAKPLSFEYIPTAVIENNSDTIGIADSDLIDPTLTDAEVLQRLQAMNALGVDTVRILIPWSGIQPFVGPDLDPNGIFANWGPIDRIVEMANDPELGLNMAVLGTLAFTPHWAVDPENPGIPPTTAPDPELWGNFVTEVAERYAGQVSAYEIWNEPNAYTFWGPVPSPENYTTILQEAVGCD